MTQSATGKAECRRLAKERLRAMTDGERIALSEKACANIVATEEYANAGTIMAYRAIRNECSGDAVILAARQANKRVAFPLCVEGNNIEAYYVDDDSCFIAGSYGILEPDIRRCERAKKEDIALIIVPGLAFDRECRRLGRGAGYYDRFLSDFRGTKAGLAFDCQLFDSIPVDAYDMPMDIVATNNGIIVKYSLKACK